MNFLISQELLQKVHFTILKSSHPLLPFEEVLKTIQALEQLKPEVEQPSATPQIPTNDAQVQQ